MPSSAGSLAGKRCIQKETGPQYLWLTKMRAIVICFVLRLPSPLCSNSSFWKWAVWNSRCSATVSWRNEWFSSQHENETWILVIAHISSHSGALNTNIRIYVIHGWQGNWQRSVFSSGEERINHHNQGV